MVFSVLGEIRLFAGKYEPRGWAFCDGRLLEIVSNTTLFSLLGFAYGSNEGKTSFALPNLPAPGGLHYIIATSGEWPRSLDGYLGAIKLFAGLFPPNGWLPCDGRVLTVDQQDVNLTRLALTVGSLYGGDGTNTVGIPRVAPLASAISVNGLALPQYIVCVKGQLARRQGGNFDAGAVEEFVGEVGAFAGDYVPGDLLEANGQSLNLSDSPALASVLDSFKSTFQLPSLPGLPALTASNQLLRTMPYLIAARGIYPARP